MKIKNQTLSTVLQRVVVAIVLQAVADVDLGTIDALFAAISAVSNGYCGDVVGAGQVDTPPGIGLCLGVGAGS